MPRRSLQQNRPIARIEPLAKLPVFWNLEDKRVIIAGSTDAAAWKAELLAACGAVVEVYSETGHLGPAMNDLIESAKVKLRKEPWHIGIFAGASLAIADCETDDEARAFSCAARAAGVPFNVIDKPTYCQFQFGSIVNRSPVILSISTDGAAPILAQAIRRRVETLLPPWIRGWAELAQTLRDTVNTRLEPGPKRRAFWEGFVDRAFSAAGEPPDVEREALLSDIDGIDHQPAKGSVTFVGAGPGDAELLTLKAVRSLQAADIILFDGSVSSEIIELARREAKRMLVGANGDCRPDNLHDVVSGLAGAGRRVVLLRATDPATSEAVALEIRRLRAIGICVDVVPGIIAPARGLLEAPDREMGALASRSILPRTARGSGIASNVHTALG